MNEVEKAALLAAEKPKKAVVVEPELLPIEAARRAVAEGTMHSDLFEDRFGVKP